MQLCFLLFQAESKGASATEYGLVFGVFELVVFITSPIYGKYVRTSMNQKYFNDELAMRLAKNTFIIAVA